VAEGLATITSLAQSHFREHVDLHNLKETVQIDRKCVRVKLLFYVHYWILSAGNCFYWRLRHIVEYSSTQSSYCIHSWDRGANIISS